MPDRYCIVSNFFGRYEFSSKIKMISEMEGVDAIILNGNILNPYLRSNDLNRSLGSFLSTQIDIYVLPGRYEIESGFNEILERFKKYGNFFNGTKKRSIKLNESQMIFLNSPEDIYNKKMDAIKDNLKQEKLEEIVKNEIKDSENTILISTYPKRFRSKNAFDYQEFGKVKCDSIFEGQCFKEGMLLERNISEILKGLDYPIKIKKTNYGSEKLSNIYKKFNINKGISSYFYDSKNRAISNIGNKVISEGKYSKEFYYNPGNASIGEFGIIEVNKGKVKYKQYQL